MNAALERNIQYNIRNKITYGIVPKKSKNRVAIVYMFVHAAGVLTQVALSYAIFLNFKLNTAYVFVLLMLSAKSGADYYNY